MDRERLFNLRVSDDERAKLQALADDEHEPASILVRRWIRQRYEARFGDRPATTSTRKGAAR